MLEIIICEDEEQLRRRYQNVIEKFIRRENLPMKIVLETSDPYEVLSFIEDFPKSRIYFLDIDLKHEMSGILLGTEIRKHDLPGFIVYVTTHPELTYLNFTYRVGAIDFIHKSEGEDLEEKIKKILYDIYQLSLNVPEEKRRFKISQKGMIQFLDYDEIVSVETDNFNRKLVIFTRDNERISFSGSLKEVEAMDNRFFYYNRSIVLNVNHISKIEKVTGEKKLFLSNGDSLIATRASMKRFKELSKGVKT